MIDRWFAQSPSTCYDYFLLLYSTFFSFYVWNISAWQEFLLWAYAECACTIQREQHRRNPLHASDLMCASLMCNIWQFEEHDKIMCSRLSGANVNIWRASAVSSQGGTTPGVAGGLASSIICATTILGLSRNVIGPTWLQCSPSTASEETLKAMKMIDCMTLGRKCLLTRLPPFSKSLKRGCNLPV